jgi:CHAT domain-containing protein
VNRATAAARPDCYHVIELMVGGAMAAGRLGWRLCLLTACLASPAASSHAQTPPPAATPMVAPPRSIADITAVLDQYRPDPAKAAAEKAAADAQPAPGLEGGALAHFYYQRGIAAGEVGRVPQQLADLRHALELGTGTTDVSFILGALGAAEFQAGNPANAIRLTERRIALDDRGGVRGREFGTYAALVRYNIARGSLDEAARRLEEVRAMFANLNFGARGTPQFFMLQPVFKAGIADAETELALARGQYREAEASARNAVELHDKHIEIYPKRSGEKPPLISVEHQRDEQIVNIAVALREQGKLIDAEVEARRALTNTLKSVDRYNAWTAGRLNVLTAILLEQGRAAEGERLALAAIDILEQVDAKGSWTVATARQTLGSALVAQSRWADALASYDAMLTGLGGDDVGTRKFGFGDLDWAAALIKADRAQPAVEMTARILQRDQQVFGDTNYKTVEARAYVAMALAAAGDRERALQGFRDALPPLLGAAPQSTEEAATAKAQRLRLILDAYIRLLAEIRGTPLEARAQLDAAAEAFRLADSARGQAVQRALGAASARLAVRDPALAGLARREQDAGKQIAALEGVLVNALSAASDQQDAGAVAALRGQIAQLRQTRDALRKDIERRFPDYAALIDPKPAPLEAARRALRPGEALLATYVSDDATLVWAVPQQGAVAFAAAPLGAARLAAMVAQLRRALDPQAGTLGEIPPYDVALANQLYAALLKPVEAGWKDAKSLLVVPDKALAQLPFGVLVTAPGKLPADGPMLFAGYKSVPFLVRQVAITQLPSVAALPTLRALPATSATREPFIGFGDPLFNAQQASGIQLADAGALTTRGIRLKLRSAPKTEGLASAELAMLPRLPDTADEVRAIARALHADPDKDVFVGAAANEHTVETLNLADRRVIAFATHGLVPGDLNGLTEPALALSAPQVAHVEGDGLLTMDEVLALKLNADWVVLSACNTAAGDGAGAEAVSGLGRAFFYAGARALLVSNWPVETTAARNLTTDLFQRQAADPALSRAEALRQAELALIDGTGEADPATRKVAFSYAHPIFWAPFSVVGDGGASTH